MNPHSLIKEEIRRVANVVNSRFMAEYWPDLPDTADEPIKSSIRGIRFDWGHPLEIINRIKEISNHDDLKFENLPAIFLFTDIKFERHKYGDYHGTNLELVICNRADPNWDSQDRELKSFIPVLRPLYDLFAEEIANSNVFSFVDGIQDDKHSAIERFFWGKQGLYGGENNIFNDYIDAIHIENLDLKVNDINC